MSANISQLNKDKPKKIAVIGIGNVGGALAGRWKSTGHEIIVGSRNPENKTSSYSALTVQDAARQADIILVATPGKAMPEVATSIGSIPGKIIIDATNSIGVQAGENTPFEILKKFTSGDVVKAFNTTGFENMANPVYDTEYGQIAIDLFMAGGSPAAKQAVKQLAGDAGFGEVWDMGNDEKVPHVEAMAFAWINLAIMQKQGRNIALKMIRRK